MPEPVDPRHLLLIGAGLGVGASVVRRFGREGFRSTLISRDQALEQLAPQLRSDGLEIEAVGADIEDLDGYRATLERIFRAPGAPGVTVYNAALPDPGEILDTTVGRADRDQASRSSNLARAVARGRHLRLERESLRRAVASSTVLRSRRASGVTSTHSSPRRNSSD